MSFSLTTLPKQIVAVVSAMFLAFGVTAFAVPASAAPTTSGIIFWGGDNGQFLTEGNALTPTALPAEFLNVGETIKSIANGGEHVCALTTSNRMFCWGSNSSGQAGSSEFVSETTEPIAIAIEGKTISQISAGWDHTCALTTDSSVYCWGENYDGQVGNSSTVDVGTPQLISGLPNNIKEVSAGGYGTCVLATDGKVFCWGDNGYGGVGNDDIEVDALAPVQITSNFASKTISDIQVSGYHRCALATDNSLFCWGGSDDGEVGNNTFENQAKPVNISGFGALENEKVTNLGLGGYHSCVSTESNKIICWGYNTYYTLGNDSGTDSALPIEIANYGVLAGKTIKQVTGGYYYSCALATDGTVGCWGYNDDSEPYLGTGFQDGSIALPESPIFGDTIPEGKIVTDLFGGGWNYSLHVKTGVANSDPEPEVLGPLKKVVDFEKNSVVLDDADKQALKSLVAKINKRAETHSVVVYGFSTALGKADVNLQNAKARATVIKKYLVANGVKPAISVKFRVSDVKSVVWNKGVVKVQANA